MPYARNEGVRIHYEVEGEGPPLVLQHGFSESVVDWYETGYVKALKPDYRLILIDARGHGDSDKPHDPEAYLLNRRVGDVTAVLDALDIATAVYWGYSMGGWIGFGMANYAKRESSRSGDWWPTSVFPQLGGPSATGSKGDSAGQRSVRGGHGGNLWPRVRGAQRATSLRGSQGVSRAGPGPSRPRRYPPDDADALLPLCRRGRSHLPRGRGVQPTHTPGNLFLVARPQPLRCLHSKRTRVTARHWILQSTGQILRMDS